MSDYRAIAGVSRTLKELLRDRMSELDVTVTLAPPDIKIEDLQGKRVNLYLYQINENSSLKNQEILGQGHSAAYGHPPLSLELYYLLTAYPSQETAETAELDAQEILGDAMRVLHDFSIITNQLLYTRAAVGAADAPILDASLLNEFERVKLSLEPAELEHLSKIWSALPSANFRRSVGYHASVVQIESQRLRQTPRLVKTRRLHVSVIKRPEITDIYRTPAGSEPTGDNRAAIDQQLTIKGRNFRARRTWVKLGGLEHIGVEPDSDSEIKINIPNDQYPIDADHPATRPIIPKDRLQPGAQLVQVLTQRETDIVEGGLDKGTTSTGQSKQASNHAVFMLLPSVTKIDPTTGGHSGLLTVEGTRLYHEDLKSYVILGDIPIRIKKKGAGDPWDNPTDSKIQIPLTDLSRVPASSRPLDLIVSAQVNGALSREEDKVYRLT